METIFKIIPARAICRIVTWPEANTMALGGVATGNIKAQLAAKAAGNSNNLASKM
jgi:hypothetical protein